MSQRPIKTHSTLMAEELLRAGWVVSSAIAAAGDPEAYEYILEWPHQHVPPFREHSVVEVCRVISFSAPYDSSSGLGRAPLVGDVGAIVCCLGFDGRTNFYEVECVGRDGETIWLATFEHDDLKQVTA